MPSCVNCGPERTPLVIVADSPLVSTGSGTPTDPLHIGLSADTPLALTVRDTASVGLTITGSGSVDDPYVLSADTGSVFNLTDLGDVESAAPVDGQVPTWVGASVGGHWEFQTPSTAAVDLGTASGVIADASLPGRLRSLAQLIASSSDLNAVVSTGFYRGQTITNAPGTGWWYFEVIAHSATFVYQRAISMASPYDSYERRLDTSVWTPWVRQAGTSDGTSSMTAGSGITLSTIDTAHSSSVTANGRQVTLNVALKTTGTLAANSTIITLPTGFTGKSGQVFEGPVTVKTSANAWLGTANVVVTGAAVTFDQWSGGGSLPAGSFLVGSLSFRA